MKEIELTVMKSDIDAVIEFLGRRAQIHFSNDADSLAAPNNEATKRIREKLDSLASAAGLLDVPLPAEPLDDSHFPGESEERLANTICAAVSALTNRVNELAAEKRKVEETLNEANAFANLNAPFSELDQLSYLTLRVGRLDLRHLDELKKTLSDRVQIIPLGDEKAGNADGSTEGRILAASSRKGRFALDSELKKLDFAPIAVPEGFKGVPAELISGLEKKLKAATREYEGIMNRGKILREECAENLQKLTASYLMASIAEDLKARLKSTKNVFLLTGWVPVDSLSAFVNDLEKLTDGRIAVRAWNPEEVDSVKEGREKVPVSLKHGAFVDGFKKVVFSYGAPLYGTIDPTPFVAFFFTILFGIMFGDLGQGFVLLLLGFLTSKRGPRFLSGFNHFSVPLKAVGVSSMVMGLLNGEVFTNERLLIGPTRALVSFLTGHPSEIDRILTIMPLAEHGGSVTKLFYFFGFTIGLGIILNSAGLIVNMINQFYLKRYEKAIFAKTGLAGITLFWYAIFIAVRFTVSVVRPDYSFSFQWFDVLGLVIPVLAIFLGPAIWRLVTGKRPVFAEGAMVFFMEGFVEILETVSTYVSNTVSFLRVGAFALSHAVLAYIVFRFSEEVATIPAGAAFGLLIMVFGNLVIILLEGMIVAIQVVRLQYYEFFSKFFTETGVEFTPFRFNQVSARGQSPQGVRHETIDNYPRPALRGDDAFRPGSPRVRR
jgi:V/A-type H+-transporting ATPase subunit I